MQHIAVNLQNEDARRTVLDRGLLPRAGHSAAAAHSCIGLVIGIGRSIWTRSRRHISQSSCRQAEIVRLTVASTFPLIFSTSV